MATGRDREVCRPFGACRIDVLGRDAEEDGWTYALIRDAFLYQG